MKSLFPKRRAILLSPLVLLLVAGCGGHSGGGSSSLTLDKVLSQSVLEGGFNAPDGAGTPSTLSIRFKDGVGVATVTSGTPGTDSFEFVSYDLSQINAQSGSKRSLAARPGGFLVAQLALNAVIAGTHLTAPDYLVESMELSVADGNAGTVTATITGKLADGTTATRPVTLTVPKAAVGYDLTGAYTGTIDVNGTAVPWRGTFTKADALHLTADVATAAGDATFSGLFTNTSFGGSYDGAKLGYPGDKVYWYVNATSNTTISGSYLVKKPDGSGALQGTITGTKGGTTTSTTNLKTGYYDGGIKAANGALDGRIIKLNVVKNTATVGSNGAMIIVTNSALPNIGGRIASVTGSGNTITINIDNFTSTYSAWTLTGTIEGTALKLTYTATLLDGTKETGSFDQLGKVDQTTPTLSGTYSGTLKDGSSGDTTPFVGTVTTSGNGTVVVGTSSTVLGNLVLPALTGYIAGNSVAIRGLYDATATPSPYTGDTFYGNFDGDLSGTGNRTLDGTYTYFLADASDKPLIVRSGTLALTKG